MFSKTYFSRLSKRNSNFNSPPLLRLLHYYKRKVRKGVRAQMHNVRNTRVIKQGKNNTWKTQINTRPKTTQREIKLVGYPSGRPLNIRKHTTCKHNKENINWRATPLVGHLSGRLHPLVGYPSGRLHPLAGYPADRLPPLIGYPRW